jgi:hypothetical protein
MTAGCSIHHLPTAYRPPEHQRAVDAIQAEIRAGAAPKVALFKPPPPKPAPSDNLLEQRIAEELAFIARQLEHLGDVLVSDPLLVARHAAALQSIDLVNQSLGHLARVVGMRDKEAAVEQISLQELKARLKRKPISGIAEG